MTRLNPLSLAVTLPCLAAFSIAASVLELKEAQTTPISAENANQVRSVMEVPRCVDEIVRGPRHGELVLMDCNDAAEVVDETGLRTVRALAEGHRPIDIAVSPDGKLVAWTERHQTTWTVRETAGGETLDIEIGGRPGRAAFSPDGKILAIGYTYWEPDVEGKGYSEMRLFDVTGQLIRTLERSGPGSHLQPVFSPDGKTLAVGNRNYETQLFDVATGKLLRRLGKEMTQEVAFSPDGKTLAAGYVDGTVALWDVATGELLRSAPSGCKEIYAVDWSPKGDVLATSGRGGKIILWEPGGLEKLKELDAPYWVIKVRFTADGTRLLTSSASDHMALRDRKIVVWAVADGVDR